MGVLFCSFFANLVGQNQGEKFFGANKNLGCFAQNPCNETKLLRFSVTPQMPLLTVCQQPIKSYPSTPLKSPILINTAKSKPFILKFQLRTYPSCTAPSQGRKKFWSGAKNLGEKNSCVGVKAILCMYSWGVGSAAFVGGLSGAGPGGLYVV